uniref:Keratin, type II cytoskeletal 1 n=1 Tax=Lygus hesperus TaxID=30085 RepID=A0A0A9XFN2_LYGHE
MSFSANSTLNSTIEVWSRDIAVTETPTFYTTVPATLQTDILPQTCGTSELSVSFGGPSIASTMSSINVVIDPTRSIIQAGDFITLEFAELFTIDASSCGLFVTPETVPYVAVDTVASVRYQASVSILDLEVLPASPDRSSNLSTLDDPFAPLYVVCTSVRLPNHEVDGTSLTARITGVEMVGEDSAVEHAKCVSNISNVLHVLPQTFDNVIIHPEDAVTNTSTTLVIDIYGIHISLPQNASIDIQLPSGWHSIDIDGTSGTSGTSGSSSSNNITDNKSTAPIACNVTDVPEAFGMLITHSISDSMVEKTLRIMFPTSLNARNILHIACDGIQTPLEPTGRRQDVVVTSYDNLNRRVETYDQGILHPVRHSTSVAGSGRQSNYYIHRTQWLEYLPFNQTQQDAVVSTYLQYLPEHPLHIQIQSQKLLMYRYEDGAISTVSDDVAKTKFILPWINRLRRNTRNAQQVGGIDAVDTFASAATDAANLDAIDDLIQLYRRDLLQLIRDDFVNSVLTLETNISTYDANYSASDIQALVRAVDRRVATTLEKNLVTTNFNPPSDLCYNGDTDYRYGETDIDCGGVFCKPCPLRSSCEHHYDCSSGACSYGTCVAVTDSLPTLLTHSAFTLLLFLIAVL